KVSSADSGHRRDLRMAEIDFGRSGNGVRWIADVGSAAQRKGLPSRHKSIAFGSVAVINQQTGTDMEPPTDKPVVMDLNGSQPQIGVIFDAIPPEILVVVEEIESAPQIRAFGHPGSGFKP